MSRGTQRRGFRDLFFGDAFLGLWLVPMFVLVGLLGAGLAGVLVSLYYSNQADGQAESQAGESQGGDRSASGDGQPEDPQAGAFPYDRPEDAGVYSLRAQPTGQPSRVGSSIAVFSNAQETYLVTTYELVARPGSPRPVATVDALLPRGTVEGRVHNYSREHDLALVVVGEGGLQVPDWRANTRMDSGDPLYLVSVAGYAGEPVVEGTVREAGPQGVVPSMEVADRQAGGALMDAQGQLVAVASLDYQPVGLSGSGAYGVPIQTVCDAQLLQCGASGQDSAGSPEPTGATPQGSTENGEQGVPPPPGEQPAE